MATRYIGIDVHSSSCTIAVMGPTGKHLREWQVETDHRALVEAIKGVAGERHICFEEGTLSDWLYQILEPTAKELEVIQPLKRRGTKNDSVDAWACAEAMRVHSRDVVRVFKAPKQFLSLRKATRAHLLIQRDMVRVKNRIHACYRARGVQGLNDEIYEPERRKSWEAKLPPAQRRLVENFCLELDGLVEATQQAEAWLREEAAKVDAVRLLSTAPGIGTLRASQIVASVVTPHRFRTRSQFWAYSGLGVVMRSSSDWCKTDTGWKRGAVAQTRGLNKNRQPLLKNVFKGAARTVLIMKDHPLKLRYQKQLSDGQKPNLAQLTLARRIAAAVLAMWKTNQEYDVAKQQIAT
jgi:transposase